MKTTKEMIEIMKAYDRGEEIEVMNLHYSNKWRNTKNPIWNWHIYDYRVKPENKKHFKDGEEIVKKQSEGRLFPGIYVYSDYFAGREEELASVDDVLWNWNLKGWGASRSRMTRAEAVALVGENVEIAPLYALGFRLAGGSDKDVATTFLNA